MKSKDWLIMNAVKSWLHNYDDGLESELTEQYRELNKELYNAFITKDTPVQKRGRPAKRQRTKTSASSTSSEEKS